MELTPFGLQILELEGHTALVTSVVVVSSGSKALSHCWTSSLDGTIRYWDFSLPELIKKVDIRFPIHSMVSGFLFICCLYGSSLNCLAFGCFLVVEMVVSLVWNVGFFFPVETVSYLVQRAWKCAQLKASLHI